MERYIASLPSTDQRETPRGKDARPILYRIEQTQRTLPVPKAQTLLVFDGVFPNAPADYLRERGWLSALTTVLQDRLRMRLREELAETYSPYVSTKTLAIPGEHYRVLIAFDTAPERMHELNKVLMHVLDSLRTYGVMEAEAGRAASVEARLAAISGSSRCVGSSRRVSRAMNTG